MAHLDRSTFEQLVQMHQAAVFRSALRVVRSPRDAEDVTQEVFLRAFRGQVPLEGHPPTHGPLCWLATRLGLNALRAERRRKTKENATMPETTASIPPDQLVADRELHAAVAAGLACLPDDLRLPLLLRYQDQLPLREVGSALGIAESTAHDRVTGALERLRRNLADRGFAVVPLALAEVLHQLPMPSPCGGFLERLLALPQSAALVAPPLAKLVTLGVLLLSGVAAAGWAALAQGTPAGPALRTVVATAEPTSHREAPASPQEPRQPVARTVPSAQEPATTHATFTGTVRDAQGWGAAGVRVVAVAAGNLKPFVLASAATDAAGVFVLPVPFAGDPVRASRIRIQVHDQAQQLLESHELQLAAECARTPLHLVLPPEAGVETTKFTAVCTVRGPGGVVLEGVPVKMYRGGEPGPRLGWDRADSEAITGADGMARLAGRTLGAKLLFVDGRPRGLRAGIARLEVAGPGEHTTALELSPGQAWHGRLVDVESKPLEWANVWLEEEGTRIAHGGAAVGRDGAIAFAGLGTGPFTLHFDAHPYSPAAVRGLLPGGEPRPIVVKRADDLRDHGEHLAEVHGVLVDAATGERLEVPPFGVEVLAVMAGSSTLATDRVVPPPPAQRSSDGQSTPGFDAVGLAAGEHAVVVRVPGHAPAVAFVELRDRELRTDLVVRLQRGGLVRGRVLRPDGAPAARVFVFVAGVGERGDALIANRDAAQQTAQAQHWNAVLSSSAYCNAAGEFELANVPTGAALRVVAVAEGVGPAVGQVVTLLEGQCSAGHDLRLLVR